MFSKRSHKENTELTERFSISENVRLIQDLPGVHRLVKLTMNEGFLPWSRPFCILSMMTLPITLLATGNNVTPRQVLHSFKSPRFGIFTIKPFFLWSGIFSSCHILLNSLVNSFTATSLSALYSSAGIPSITGVLPIFVFFSACLTSASLISVASISLISSVSTSFSSTGFVGASLTNTSSKCSAHLSSLAFLSFIISPLLFLTAAL